MTHQPTPDPETDPTLAVAERQLVLLGELAQIAMMAARAFGSSAVAAAAAEQRILAEEWYTPEVGRARACGAKDAAESLQKVSRAVRLTLVLEMNLAEIVRDIRSGKLTYIGGIAHRKDAGERPAGQINLQDRRRPAGSFDQRDSDTSSYDRNTERFVEFDRPDAFPHARFHEAVEQNCADVGAKLDCSHWKVAVPNPDVPAPQAEPTRREAALSP